MSFHFPFSSSSSHRTFPFSHAHLVLHGSRQSKSQCLDRPGNAIGCGVCCCYATHMDMVRQRGQNDHRSAGRYSHPSRIPTRSSHLLRFSQTLGKLLFHLLGIMGTVIFLVMAGVSLWWLIFLKVVSETHLNCAIDFLACPRLNTMRRSSRRPAPHRISSRSCGSPRSYSKQWILFI